MRSLNRHYAAREHVRKTRILATHYRRFTPDKPWKGYHRLCMNEPGWWVREFMTQPARIRARRLCVAITHGADPDGIVWPDSRKPHRYYW